jgi:hypothetical protein
MQYRRLGRTGFEVSTVSFGAWAIGGTWGPVSDEESLRALHRAVDRGVNFIDTADVYGDGRSERLVARLRRERRETIHVATKAGRRLPAQTLAGYPARTSPPSWSAASRTCGPTASTCCSSIARRPTSTTPPEVFGILDDLAAAGKIRSYGVSVERVEEALKAIEFENVATVQIIYKRSASAPRTVSSKRPVAATSACSPGCPSPRDAGRQDDAREHLRRGRPSALQPARAPLRPRRNLSGIDFETGSRPWRRARRSCRRGSHGRLGDPLDPDAPRRDLRDPRREAPRAGGRERRRGRSAPLDEATMAAVRALYDARIRPLVHQRW